MLRMNLSMSLNIWVKNYSEDNSFSFLMDLEIKNSVISGVINQHCTVWTIMSLKGNHSGGRIVIAIKNLRWTKIFLSKGQLISKENCQAVNSSKKWTNEFLFTSMQHVFVCFLEKIEDRKKTFRNYLTFTSHTNCAKLWLNDVNSWKVQMQ